MLLGLATILCLLSVPAAGGRLRALGDLRVRGGGLIIAGLGLQVLVIEILPDAPEAIVRGAHVASYGLAAVVLWLNRRLPFVWLLALGGAANAVAIAANGGVMPARPGALATAGLEPTPGAFANSAAVAHPHVAWLGDVFATPAAWPFANVFSVGDVLIVCGLLLGLHVWCGSRPGAALGRWRWSSPAARATEPS